MLIYWKICRFSVETAILWEIAKSWRDVKLRNNVDLKLQEFLYHRLCTGVVGVLASTAECCEVPSAPVMLEGLGTELKRCPFTEHAWAELGCVPG